MEAAWRASGRSYTNEEPLPVRLRGEPDHFPGVAEPGTIEVTILPGRPGDITDLGTVELRVWDAIPFGDRLTGAWHAMEIPSGRYYRDFIDSVGSPLPRFGFGGTNTVRDGSFTVMPGPDARRKREKEERPR